jgi:MFS family permease
VLAGFAVIVHWTPFLLFSVYFGALADRFDCRKIIQAAGLMYMGVSLTWAVLFLTGTIQIWHACVLLVIHGMASVLWSPGSQLIIHDHVGPKSQARSVERHGTQLGFVGTRGRRRVDAAFGTSAGLFANAALFTCRWYHGCCLCRIQDTERKAPAGDPALAFATP